MPGFRSGKNGRATINGTTVKIKRWQVNPKGEKLDVTNSESSGNGEYIGGVLDVDWEFDFDYYLGSTPFTLATPGSIVTNVIFYIGDVADATTWTFPSAFVENGSNTSEVRGKVSGTIRGCSTGTFTKPTN